MTVLYIASVGEFGGATKSLLTLISILKKQKIKPIVITPNKNGIVMDYCKKNGIEVHYIKHYKLCFSLENSKIKNFIKIISSPIYAIYSYLRNKIAVKQIEKTINISNVDFIHSNLTRDEIGFMLTKKHKTKHIVHLREYGTLDFKCIYLRPNYYKYINKNTYKFIAISNSIKDFFIKQGLEENKINVIYNGIDTNLKCINYSENKSNKKIKIVILGSTISNEKGQIQVIDALAKINSTKIELYIYGKCNQNYRDYLMKIIKNNNLEKKVHFIGYKNKATDDLIKYDIAITPSKSEAFGRVTVEYMLAKLPVIASNTGANSEILINNKTGLLYNYGDIDELCNKINQLANSFDLRKKIGNNGYKRAIKHFTAEINATEIKKLYLNNSNGDQND